MKLHIVFWRSNRKAKWAAGPGAMHEDLRIAEAQLRFDELSNPEWEHVIATCEVPGHEEPTADEQAQAARTEEASRGEA